MTTRAQIMAMGKALTITVIGRAQTMDEGAQTMDEGVQTMDGGVQTMDEGGALSIAINVARGPVVEAVNVTEQANLLHALYLMLKLHCTNHLYSLFTPLTSRT